MKVYVSVDIEGIAGVVNGDQISRGGVGYPQAQELMTREANAAVEGAFEGGASAVTVADGHGPMDNLRFEFLDRRARVISGRPRVGSMVSGIDDAFDVALFVGYHAPVGAPGNLSHSFNMFFTDVRLNGKTLSETEANALYASSFGVPVGMVAGDDVICELVSRIASETVCVPVKRSVGWTAADSLHPLEACDQIRRGASLAVSKAKSLVPFPIPDTLVLEVQMDMASSAEMASRVPGADRVDEFTVRRQVSNPTELMGLIAIWNVVASNSSLTRIGHVVR